MPPQRSCFWPENRTRGTVCGREISPAPIIYGNFLHCTLRTRQTRPWVSSTQHSHGLGSRQPRQMTKGRFGGTAPKRRNQSRARAQEPHPNHEITLTMVSQNRILNKKVVKMCMETVLEPHLTVPSELWTQKCHFWTALLLVHRSCGATFYQRPRTR